MVACPYHVFHVAVGCGVVAFFQFHFVAAAGTGAQRGREEEFELGVWEDDGAYVTSLAHYGLATADVALDYSDAFADDEDLSDLVHVFAHVKVVEAVGYVFVVEVDMGLAVFAADVHVEGFDRRGDFSCVHDVDVVVHEVDCHAAVQGPSIQTNEAQTTGQHAGYCALAAGGWAVNCYLDYIHFN